MAVSGIAINVRSEGQPLEDQPLQKKGKPVSSRWFSFVKELFVSLGASSNQKQTLRNLRSEGDQLSREIVQLRKEDPLLPCFKTDNASQIQEKEKRLEQISTETQAIRLSASRKGLVGVLAFSALSGASIYFYSQWQVPGEDVDPEINKMRSLAKELFDDRPRKIPSWQEDDDSNEDDSNPMLWNTGKANHSSSEGDRSLVSVNHKALTIAQYINKRCTEFWAKAGYHPKYDVLCYREFIKPLFKDVKESYGARWFYDGEQNECKALHDTMNQAWNLESPGSENWHHLNLAANILGFSCPRNQDEEALTVGSDPWQQEQLAAKARLFGEVFINEKALAKPSIDCGVMPELPPLTTSAEWKHEWWTKKLQLKDTWGKWIANAFDQLCCNVEQCKQEPKRVYSCLFRPLSTRLPDGERKRQQGAIGSCKSLYSRVSPQKGSQISELFSQYCPSTKEALNLWIENDPMLRDLASYQRFVLSRLGGGLSDDTIYEPVFDRQAELRGDPRSGSAFFFNEGMRELVSAFETNKKLVSEVLSLGPEMGQADTFLNLCTVIASALRLPEPLNNKEAKGLISTIYSYAITQGKEEIADLAPKAWKIIEALYTRGVPQFSLPIVQALPAGEGNQLS